MNATGQKNITPEICLSNFVENIQKRKVSPCSIMAVNGAPKDRVSIHNMVYALGRAIWDILTLRLSQDIILKRSWSSVFI